MGRLKTIRTAALAAVLGTALCLGGCGDLKKTFNFTSIDEQGNEEKLDLNFPAKNLLAKGMEDYSVGKYFTAIEYFQEILNRYPFSAEAPLAELKAADCSYHLERYQEALVLYEEFTNRHPTNESIPYVLYQRGMSNFKQLDRVDRDTSSATKAIEMFRQLIKAYPQSPYAAEAKARIAAANQYLADHEYFVAEFYVRTEKYDQAKVRLKYLLAKYSDQPVAEKARTLLADLEAGNPPRSALTSWIPRLNDSVWPFTGQGAAEISSSD